MLEDEVKLHCRVERIARAEGANLRRYPMSRTLRSLWRKMSCR